MREFLVKHNKDEKASFHMPGHKGAAFFARLGCGGGLSSADHDITEIPGADDLRHPDGIIKTITDKYAAIYGSSRAFISVNGSSALIMAAIMTCVKPGHKLIASADCHISVKNGAELAGAEIVYVEPQVTDPWGDACRETLAAPGSLANKGIKTSPNCDSVVAEADGRRNDAPGSFSVPAGLSAESVAKALDEYQDADAVILPSPNYFGVVSGIRSIADAVHQRGKVLIVDQAHGAHLKMFRGMMPDPAEECGADIVIVSTHKTLASFTQTAVANIFSTAGRTTERREDAAVGSKRIRVDQDEYERKLLMLESTSPSYVLMESLAVNAEIMEKYGDKLARAWREDLDWFYDNVKNIPKIRVLTRSTVKQSGADFDDSKIVVDFSGLGLSGEEAEKALIEKGIYPEFSTGSVVMFLTGIGNVRQDHELLLDALSEIACRE